MAERIIKETSQIPFLFDIYHKYFGKGEKLKKEGRFLDIGAHDGITHSNTYILLRSGWLGHYFEPNKRAYKKMRDLFALKSYNSRVYIYNVALGLTEGTTTLFADGELSTIKPDYVDVIRNTGLFGGYKPVATEVKLRRLDKYFLDRTIWNTESNPIDVVSIDVEGAELDVIEGGSFFNDRMKIGKPKMFIIETHRLSDHWNQFMQEKDKGDKIYALMESNGYFLEYEDDINSIFIRDDDC